MKRRSRLAVGALAALPTLLGLTSASSAHSSSAAAAGPCLAPGQVSTLDSPSPRRSFGVADDPDHEQVVLFGGWNGHNLGDTWTWDGTAWTRQQPITTPSPRYGAGMTYDPARGQVVLFGGADGENSLADTWIWDGANWIEQHPAHSPPAGANFLAYDAGTQKLVMNEEESIDSFTNWTWDGTDWQEVVRDSFDGRTYAAMSSDGDGVMLFGGGKEIFEDRFVTHTTYIWDGATWRLRKPVDRPSRRYSAGLAYDAAGDEVVLFGGYTQPTNHADTWTWDGSNWTLLNPANRPKPRYWMRMAYDSTRQEVVLFGGTRSADQCFFGDTWTWDGSTWEER